MATRRRAGRDGGIRQSWRRQYRAPPLRGRWPASRADRPSMPLIADRTHTSGPATALTGHLIGAQQTSASNVMPEIHMASVSGAFLPGNIKDRVNQLVLFML